MNTGVAIPVALVVALLLIGWRVHVSGAGFQTWFLYQVARVYTTVMFRLQTSGRRTVPEDDAVLIISNHTSPVDPMLIWADLRRCYPGPRIRRPGFMMAREYYEMGGIPGWIFRVMESIPLDRNGRDMGPARAALQRLKDGRIVSVFPEGRINDESPDEKLLPGDTGAAWLALKAQVPVIPILIQNAPRGTTMGNSFLVRTRSTLTYGDPIDLSAWHGQRPTQKMLVEITDLIMQQLASLGNMKAAPSGEANVESQEPSQGS